MLNLLVFAGTNELSDVKGHWAEAQIIKLNQMGIIGGYPDGTFNPKGNVKRGEFIKLLITALKYETVDGDSFDDTGSHWAKKYIESAGENGVIVLEEEGDNFRPDEFINRLDMVTMMIRGLKLSASTGSNPFTDMSVNTYAAKAYEEYLVRGYLENSKALFKPTNNSSRAEAAVIISRTMEYKENPVAYKLKMTGGTATTGKETTTTPTTVPMKEQIEKEKGMYLITKYKVENGKITIDSNYKVPEKYTKYQTNTDVHHTIWAQAKAIIPDSHEKFFKEYNINTDGPDNNMAHVSSIYGENKEWEMTMDIEDSLKADGSFNAELNHTLVHEFAHVMSLNTTQIELSDLTKSQTSRYVISEGVTKENSYLNKFYQAFWVNIINEWSDIEKMEVGDAKDDAVTKQYEKYKDRFVSDYAATDPVEDFAETFTNFVKGDKPTGTSIANQKILFFYNYPELVTMRDEIRKAL